MLSHLWSRRMSDGDCSLVGDGHDRKKLEKKVVSLNLSDRVDIHR